ncbi:MAG: HAD family hydrolase [Bradymonadales bacterium]|nr:HAD family hydrolase [Bradymonadales bacterium]
MRFLKVHKLLHPERAVAPFQILGSLKELHDLLRDGRYRHIRLFSFDVFDTILWRLLSPRAVEEASATSLLQGLGKAGFDTTTDPEEIVRHRAAYAMSRRTSRFAGEWEWLLDDWLAAWARQYRLPVELVRRIGADAELDCEARFTRVCEGFPDLLDHLRCDGRTVVASSATPLSTEQLTGLLWRQGLHFDRVFSSGSLKVSKRRGTLFRVLVQTTGRTASECLHIGDNLKNDVARPLLEGFQVVWVPAGNHRTALKPLRHRKLQKRDRHSLAELERLLYVSPPPVDSHPLYRLGYSHLAPLLLLFSFVQWQIFRSHGVDLVFYLARDGRSILDAYDLLADILPDSPPRRYLRLSRQSVSLSGPKDYLLTLSGIPGKFGRSSIGEFLGSFQLPLPLLDSILTTSQLPLKAPFNAINQNRLLSALDLHNEAIQACREQQRQLIRDYIKQESEPLRPSRIGLVDSGWGCTTQDAVWFSLGGETTVSGCYLGISRHGVLPTSTNLKHGLLRDDYRTLRYANAMIRSAGAIRVLEIVLREPGPTVVRLSRSEDGGVVPVLSRRNPLTPTEIANREQFSRGLEQGLESLKPALETMVSQDRSWSESSIEAAAAALTRRVVSRPDRATARSIMELSVDEGAAGEKKGSIGLDGLRSGTTWYAGVLAQHGLSIGLPALECAAEWYARRYQK